MKKIFVLGAFLNLTVCGPARAILLEGEGNVRVNRGEGYIVVHGSTEVGPGDLVMLDANSRARLTYVDGCSTDVPSGSITVVAAESPCSRSWMPTEGGGVVLPLVIGGLTVGPLLAVRKREFVSAPQFVVPLPASP